jgi:hypothetical protein
MAKHKKSQEAKRDDRVSVDLGTEKARDVLQGLNKARMAFPGTSDSWFVVEALRSWLIGKGYSKKSS